MRTLLAPAELEDAVGVQIEPRPVRHGADLPEELGVLAPDTGQRPLGDVVLERHLLAGLELALVDHAFLVSFGGATAVAASRQALRLVRQNIGIVGGVNLVALTAAMTRGLSPTTAAFVHNGSTVLAAVNGLRPLLGAGRRTPRVHDDHRQESNDG